MNEIPEPPSFEPLGILPSWNQEIVDSFMSSAGASVGSSPQLFPIVSVQVQDKRSN